MGFNWVGKSEFKTGPLSSFSPIDTKMNFVFNARKMVLNADMVETMGGKQWGLKIHQDELRVQRSQDGAQRRHGGDYGRKAVGFEDPQEQVQHPHWQCSLAFTKAF